MIAKYKTIKKKLKEETGFGAIEVVESDCNTIPEIKKLILDEYKKITKKEGVELQAWNKIPNKYNILPKDYKDQQKEINQKVKGGSIIWDTVDVVYSFKRESFILRFKGFKLDESRTVKY